jgi:hypothetical protein
MQAHFPFGFGNAYLYLYPGSTAGLEMDVRDLSFDDASFDVAIDKGKYTSCVRALPGGPPNLSYLQERWMR